MDADTDSCDLRQGMDNERLTPIWDLEEVQIGPSTHQVTMIGTSLFKEEKHKLVDQLIRNIDWFAWAPFDMSEIDIRVVFIRLTVNPFARTVA